MTSIYTKSALINQQFVRLRNECNDASCSKSKHIETIDMLGQMIDSYRDEQNVRIGGLEQALTDVARAAAQAQERIEQLIVEREDWRQDAATSEAKLETACNQLQVLQGHLDHANHQWEVHSEAYDNQKTLTRNALIESHKLCDEACTYRDQRDAAERKLASVSELLSSDDVLDDGHSIARR